MGSYLIEMFTVSLALTIVVELAVAFLLKRTEGARQAKYVLLVILVNVLTNPPAVLLCQLGKLHMPMVPEIFIELALEMLVVTVEAWIYRSFAKSPRWKIDRPVRLAVTANVCSWLTGVILLTIRRSL